MYIHMPLKIIKKDFLKLIKKFDQFFKYEFLIQFFKSFECLV